MIEIICPTYNSGPYLAELIRSLELQTEQGWRLILMDDGSSDGTDQRILELARSRPEKYRVLDGGHRMGARRAFSHMLAATTAPYVAFCDHDDYWLPGKLQRLAAVMAESESRWGAGTPLLVHSDAIPTDSNLVPLAHSLRRMQGVQPSHTVGRLAMTNFVTGCVSMANRALIEQSSPIPDEAVMHDWWMALVARCFGQIVDVPDSTLLYRQHGANDTGAKRWTGFRMEKLLRYLTGKAAAPELENILRRTSVQAATFVERYGARMSADQLRAMRSMAHLGKAGGLQRRLDVVRGGLWRPGVLRNLSLFVFL